MLTCLTTLQVFKTLVEKTKDIKGAKVEHHKFCASVHYRNVDENVSASFICCCSILKAEGCLC